MVTPLLTHWSYHSLSLSHLCVIRHEVYSCNYINLLNLARTKFHKFSFIISSDWRRRKSYLHYHRKQSSFKTFFIQWNMRNQRFIANYHILVANALEIQEFCTQSNKHYDKSVQLLNYFLYQFPGSIEQALKTESQHMKHTQIEILQSASVAAEKPINSSIIRKLLLWVTMKVGSSRYCHTTITNVHHYSIFFKKKFSTQKVLEYRDPPLKWLSHWSIERNEICNLTLHVLLEWLIRCQP